ncbi:DNA recombination protein RmuC [Zhihengliuella sp.]|uniref:DNA recombination protein RmuC n=1 Tax=Zhihengliuella sp. TaxID=1954483 RepID=UPI002811D21A|nr:DNA recombination protein RmuC [Zhihengliuella sp.]
MDTLSAILPVLTLLVGAALGAAGAWWVAGRTSDGPSQQEYDAVVQRLNAVQVSLAAAEAERTALQERLAAEQQSWQERLAAERSALQSQVMAERERSGQDRSVAQMLAPLADRLRTVQEHVALLERDRVEQFGQLSQQLAAAAEQDAALLRTTASLAGALKNNTTRGTWGEAQLRRVVEAAGMLAQVDFTEQATLRAVRNGAGAGLRPDMVVNLPGGKAVAVDSKVPLSSYLAAQEIGASGTLTAEQEQEWSRLMAAHAKALRSHVDQLGSKEYWDSLPGSPELVVCFLPAESFLASALQADPGLLDHAYSKSVALASPATLFSILKGLAFAWRQELLTDNARTLFEESRELYKRLGTLGGHINGLGKSLKTSVERYNSFVGTLESRVLPSTRRLQDLDPGLKESTQSEALDVTPVESTPRVLSAPELLPQELTQESA